MMLLQLDTNSQTLPILLHDHTCPPISVACAIGPSVNLLPNLIWIEFPMNKIAQNSVSPRP
jgi:hypothetical protein